MLGWTTPTAAWSPTAVPVWADTAVPVCAEWASTAAPVWLWAAWSLCAEGWVTVWSDAWVTECADRPTLSDWATAYDPDTEEVDELQRRVREAPVPNTVWLIELIAWVSSMTNGSSWLWDECAATAAPAWEETSAPAWALWASAACAEGWVTAWFAWADGLGDGVRGRLRDRVGRRGRGLRARRLAQGVEVGVGRVEADRHAAAVVGEAEVRAVGGAVRRAQDREQRGVRRAQERGSVAGEPVGRRRGRRPEDDRADRRAAAGRGAHRPVGGRRRAGGGGLGAQGRERRAEGRGDGRRGGAALEGLLDLDDPRGVADAALGVAHEDEVADVPVLAVAERAVLVDAGLEARLGAGRGEVGVAALLEDDRRAGLDVARVEERLAAVEPGRLGARPADRDVAVGALALAGDDGEGLGLEDRVELGPALERLEREVEEHRRATGRRRRGRRTRTRRWRRRR